MKSRISKSFKCVKTLESVYSGGQAAWCGGSVWTLHGGGVNIVAEGEVKHRVVEAEDPVICFTLLPDTEAENTCLVTAHKSGLVRIWDYKADTGQPPAVVRTFRSIHSGTIALMSLHRVAEAAVVLATGGTDGSVKVSKIAKYLDTSNVSRKVVSCIINFINIFGFQFPTDSMKASNHQILNVPEF